MFLRLVALISAATLLAACGGGERRPEPVPGSFTTEILADGTKLFTYTLAPEPGGGERRLRPPPGEEGRRPPEPRLPDPHKSLQLLLTENGYCREGYVTLEQYRLGPKQVVRGECRDGANAGDRSRFGAR